MRDWVHSIVVAKEVFAEIRIMPGLIGLVKNSAELDEIYDNLVKLRHRMATELGYKNFVQLGYMRMGRSDYGPEDVAKSENKLLKTLFQS